MAIRPNTLVADYDYISEHDEAVDRSVEDFDLKWKHYRDGMGDPPLIPGSKPTVFRLRHLGSADRMFIGAANGGHELLLTAAGIALIGVTGLSDEEGKPVVFRKDATKFGPYRITHAHGDIIAAIPMSVLADIGSIAMERAALRPS